MGTEKFIIEGGRALKGSIDVMGSKNATTPIIAATLLTSEPCIISNIPLIEDVLKMINLIQGLGARVTWMGEREVKIEAKDIDPEKVDRELISQMRSSLLIMGPLLARTGKAKLNHPGGCIIGTRSIKTHLDGFKDIGAEIKISQVSPKSDYAKYSEKTNLYSLKIKNQSRKREVVLGECSVTATENILMASALNPEETTIKIAAAEPHVQELAEFLRGMGATISGERTSTIKIKGKKKLKGVHHTISPDYLEAGTYILMGCAAGGDIIINNTPIEYLDLFLKKLKDFGGNFEVLSKRSIRVKTPSKLKIDRIKALPYPGIPTDLQSVFGVLSTQAEGLTLIHDPLYNGRLKYLEELNKMGAEIIICDPHRAVINGPTELCGAELGPLDLRSGAALIVAGIIAKGITTIKNISQVDRGYEKIENRLQKIGVNIKRIDSSLEQKK